MTTIVLKDLTHLIAPNKHKSDNYINETEPHVIRNQHYCVWSMLSNVKVFKIFQLLGF